METFCFVAEEELFDFKEFKKREEQRKQERLDEANAGLNVLRERKEELLKKKVTIEAELSEVDEQIKELEAIFGGDADSEKSEEPKKRDRGVITVLRQLIKDTVMDTFSFKDAVDEVRKIKPNANPSTVRSGLARLTRQGVLREFGPRGDRSWVIVGSAADLMMDATDDGDGGPVTITHHKPDTPEFEEQVKASKLFKKAQEIETLPLDAMFGIITREFQSELLRRARDVAPGGLTERDVFVLASGVIASENLASIIFDMVAMGALVFEEKDDGSFVVVYSGELEPNVPEGEVKLSPEIEMTPQYLAMAKKKLLQELQIKKPGLDAKGLVWFMEMAQLDEKSLGQIVNELEAENLVEIEKSPDGDGKVVRLPVDPDSKEGLKQVHVTGRKLFPGAKEPPHL